MNIETLIQEMHDDYRAGKTLAFSEKLESLLEFGDMVKLCRKTAFDKGPMYVGDYALDLGWSVFNWPNSE